MRRLLFVVCLLGLSASASAELTEKVVADFNDLNNFVIVCDGKDVSTGKYDDDIKIVRVASGGQIKYEVYSKDNGQMIMACDNIGLN